jgi:subtilisin family serine protease
MDLRRKTMSNNNSIIEAPLKYSKFWHLEAIGLLQPSQGAQLPPTKEPAKTGVWDSITGQHKSKVAIIDTGVSAHPYLAGRLPPLNGVPSGAGTGQEDKGLTGSDKSYNLDLTGAPTVRAIETNRAKLPGDELSDAWLKKMDLLPTGVKSWRDDVLELINNNINKLSVSAGAPVTSNQQFSAHGTACAGLVAASDRHYVASRSGSGPTQFEPPYYCGVDRESEIISITTSFSPRPDLLTLAFVAAANIGADVILFPRGLPREIEFAVEDFSVENEKSILSGAEVKAAQENLARPWEALRQTIIAISRRIPIVCAVGNECEEKPIAPASFAADDNGIIAVAAMNYYGYRSSYSNFGGPKPDAVAAQGGNRSYKVTVAAPSDDAEIFNIDQARLDRTNRFIADHPYDYFVKKTGKVEIPFGEASIRSIDIPGAFGFSDTNTNVDAKIWIEPESFFTEFGGTSAAASIVAGVASLVQRAAKFKTGGTGLDGKQMRKLLHDSASKGRSPHLPDLIKPELLGRDDIVNGVTLKFEEKFGGGLVDAAAAVKAALAGDF